MGDRRHSTQEAIKNVLSGDPHALTFDNDMAYSV